jgi:hypothetical protein
MSATGATLTPPEDASSVVTRAVRSVYARWFALRIAAEQFGRAGAPVANALLDDTLLLVHSARVPTPDDYLDLMDDAFEQLETNVEDGSMEEVAHMLVRMRAAAEFGDLRIALAQIEKQGTSDALPWKSDAVSRAAADARQTDSDLEDDDALDGSMEVERPRDVREPERRLVEPVIDEDGFETVARKKGPRGQPRLSSA